MKFKTNQRMGASAPLTAPRFRVSGSNPGRFDSYTAHSLSCKRCRYSKGRLPLPMHHKRCSWESLPD